MPEMNRKLQRFTAAILAEATAESARSIAALRHRRTEALAAAEDAALTETYHYIHSEVSRIKADAGRRVSRQLQDNKRALALRRSEIAAEVFDAVRGRIAAYTETPAYEARLCALLREAMKTLAGAEDLRVYLRSADQGLSGSLRRCVPDGAAFLEGRFRLGGLVAESPALGLRCDASFDSALEELEGRFAELFGLSLSDFSDFSGQPAEGGRP